MAKKNRFVLFLANKYFRNGFLTGLILGLCFGIAMHFFSADIPFYAAAITSVLFSILGAKFGELLQSLLKDVPFIPYEFNLQRMTHRRQPDYSFTGPIPVIIITPPTPRAEQNQKHLRKPRISGNKKAP